MSTGREDERGSGAVDGVMNRTHNLALVRAGIHSTWESETG